MAELLEQVIHELARFLNITFEEARRRVEEYNVGIAAQKWNELSPQTTEEVERFYQDTDHYLYELIPWNYSSPEFHKKVEALFFYHNKKILELGAGIGSLCIALQYAGNQMTYCDIGSRLQEFARQRFQDRGFAIPIVSNLTGLKDFDIVVAIDFFEHIHPDKLPNLLKEINAVLKDGGFLYYRSAFKQQFPVATPNINTASYWDRIWSIEGGNTWRQYPLTFKKIASHIEPNDSILDIGCGAGILLDALKPYCKEVAGLDISSVAINILESRGIKGKIGELPEICFPDKSFDVVVATEIIEHLDNPSMLIREAIRVARKGVILSVPDNVLGPKELAEHRQLFTEAILKKMLKQFFDDFNIEEFTDTFPTSDGIISLPTLLAVCNVKSREIEPIKKRIILPMHYDHSAYFNKLAKDAGLSLRANGDLVKGGESQGVQIGIPIRGDMKDNIFYSFIGLKKPLGTKLTKITSVDIGAARNEIIRRLEKDWLFFMDSDQTFHPDTLNRLLSWDLPVISGVYFKSPGEPIPHVYRYVWQGESHLYISMATEVKNYLCRYKEELQKAMPAIVLPARREDLIECDGVGGGCLLVHRRVFEAIKDPWFECVKGTQSGEDFDFCRKVQTAGFKIYADPGVLCGHEQKDVTGHRHFLHWADPETFPYPWGEIEQTDKVDSKK